MNEKRTETRYDDIGKVVISELCALSGILDDISLSGCKVHFPCIIPVDMEAEYKVNITLTRTPDQAPLQLLCKPKWVQDFGETTQIGFINLYSPDEIRLKEYIKYLASMSQDDFPEIK